MKITYVAKSKIPSRTANSMHVMKMCQAYQNLGHEITLISEKGPAAKKSTQQDLVDHYGLDGLFPMHLHKTISKTWKSEFALHAALLAFFRKTDLVVTRHLRTAALTTLLGIRTICEFHAVPAAGWSLHQYCRSSNKEKTIVITEQLRKDILMTCGDLFQEKKIEVCPDCADLGQFENLPDQRLLRMNLGIEPERITIGYSGHFYPGRGIWIILSLAVQFPDYLFLLMGGEDADIQRIANEVRCRGLKNIVITGFIKNSLIPHYLSACDILLMPYQTKFLSAGGGSDIGKWASPMKMFEYMAAGKVILSSRLKIIEEILNDYNAILCDPEKIEDWIKGIQKAVTYTDWASSIAAQARLDVENFTWEKRARRILEDVQVR